MILVLILLTKNIHFKFKIKLEISSIPTLSCLKSEHSLTVIDKVSEMGLVSF